MYNCNSHCVINAGDNADEFLKNTKVHKGVFLVKQENALYKDIMPIKIVSPFLYFTPSGRVNFKEGKIK